MGDRTGLQTLASARVPSPAAVHCLRERAEPDITDPGEPMAAAPATGVAATLGQILALRRHAGAGWWFQPRCEHAGWSDELQTVAISVRARVVEPDAGAESGTSHP